MKSNRCTNHRHQGTGACKKERFKLIGIRPMLAVAIMLADLSASAASIEEVVVTAQRRSESVSDVPIAITVQTANDLKSAGIVDIRDLGNAVPGLYITTQGSNLQPVIRGVQTRIAEPGGEQPVSIYLDGIYQSSPLFNIFDLVDIEQVEVLKGPQGTLFGRNTTGGAIRITTKKPQYETEGKVDVEYGRYTGSDENSGDATVKGFVTGAIAEDTLAYSLSASYREIEGYLTNDVDGGSSGSVEKYQVRGKLLWEPTENLSFLFTGFKAEKEDLESFYAQPIPGTGSTASFYADGVVPNKPWHTAGPYSDGSNPIDTETSSYSLKADLVLDGWGTVSSMTAYSESEAELSIGLAYADSPSCYASFACFKLLQTIEPETFQQEIQFVSEQFGNTSFVTGLYYYEDETFFLFFFVPLEDSDGRGIRNTGFNQPDNAVATTEAWAWFGEVNYDISDHLHLIVGLRYSENEVSGKGSAGNRYPTTGAVEDDAWTPRVALNYDLTDQTSIYASYTEGFKSTVINSSAQSDQIAEPEEIKAYEVGLKSRGDDYAFDASIFYYDQTNLQSQVWDQANLAAILSNADDSTSYGFELDGIYNLTEQFQVRATAAYLNSEYGDFVGTATQGTFTAATQVLPTVPVDVTGDQFILAPEWTASLGATYTASVDLGEIEISGILNYTDDSWTDFLRVIKQDAYTTFNATVSLVPNFNDQVSFALYGRNLTNEEYFSGALGGANAYPVHYAAPRQIGISVEYGF